MAISRASPTFVRRQEFDHESDKEKNRLSARVQRYGKVGANVGGVAARIAGRACVGLEPERDKDAASLAAALGGLKGPIMKVAQLLATIPEALPAEYAAELGQLQSQAPPMGWPFVRRRMAAELGPDWEAKFASFAHEAAASASLGQVHQARRAMTDARLPPSCNIRTCSPRSRPISPSSACCSRSIARMSPAIETSEMLKEIAARLREELDYDLEAGTRGSTASSSRDDPLIRVPEVRAGAFHQAAAHHDLARGRRLLDYTRRPLEERNQIARAMFRAWWYPFSHYGVIHGDPHLGNYTVFEDATGSAAGINLLDYGCMRTFAPKFIQGVIDLYHGLLTGRPRADRARLRDLGLRRSLQRADRHSQYLGEVHLRPDAR